MIAIKNKSPFLCLLIFLISSQTALATEIKVTVDRNPISINESVQLTFTASTSPDDDPDFSPLEKDFNILNQSKQSKSSWINGESSKTIQWVLNIMPKKVGDLLIPVIAFGDDHSKQSNLRVTENQTSNDNQNAELFLEVEATPKTTYVQSQVIYTLRLFSRVQLSQAQLSELELTDALVEKLGEVKKYNTLRNGVQYTVNELNYAIFPQKSGEINIPPMQLTAGVVSSSRARFNGFFNRQISKTKRIQSNAIRLNVQAVPETFK
ncbi:MAG: protein BatD, partial [Methylomarinum sp.]|nr:protein BatD [Methylomarinum sp.]